MAAILSDEEIKRAREMLTWVPGAQVQLQEVERRTQGMEAATQEMGQLRAP